MYNLVKFQGYIKKLEIHEGTLNTLSNVGDSQILSSAILSSIAESVSLGAQTVFLASHSRLHVQSVVMEIDDKVFIGQFHRTILKENEYVVCVARRLEKNLYELYSILSPKTGLLHMQVGMGAAKKKSKESSLKGSKFIFFISLFVLILIIITHDLACAKEVGDRIVMLLDGKFERQGSFEEIFDTDDARVRAFYNYNFIL